jgi:hypothetical protein
MEIKKYIFLTAEGFTYQPHSEKIEPDIENLQVIGFAKGKNSDEAFVNLKNEAHDLLETTFNEIFSYELSKEYEASKKYHVL